MTSELLASSEIPDCCTTGSFCLLKWQKCFALNPVALLTTNPIKMCTCACWLFSNSRNRNPDQAGKLDAGRDEPVSSQADLGSVHRQETGACTRTTAPISAGAHSWSWKMWSGGGGTRKDLKGCFLCDGPTEPRGQRQRRRMGAAQLQKLLGPFSGDFEGGGGCRSVKGPHLQEVSIFQSHSGYLTPGLGCSSDWRSWPCPSAFTHPFQLKLRMMKCGRQLNQRARSDSLAALRNVIMSWLINNNPILLQPNRVNSNVRWNTSS